MDGPIRKQMYSVEDMTYPIPDTRDIGDLNAGAQETERIRRQTERMRYRPDRMHDTIHA